MNVKRFTARTSRDALALVRQDLGEDAVVLSTKPCAEGVEMVAMAPESMAQIERMATAAAPLAPAVAERPEPVRAQKAAPARAQAVARPAEETVTEDAERLAMSTLSFQDYVRDRMLKRRQAALQAESSAARAAAPVADVPTGPLAARMAEATTARPAVTPRRAPAAVPPAPAP